MRPGLAAALLAVLACSAASARAQEAQSPHLGYCYPAGGRQGTLVRVFAGGQSLRGASGVLVSGAGVRATVARDLGRKLRLNTDERRELKRRLEHPQQALPPDAAKLPRHPLLDHLAELGPLELEFLEREFLKPDGKQQANAQLAETVLLEVTIDPDAAPGDRELRLQAALGLSNPLVFQVGRFPELLEPRPYDPGDDPAPAVDLPVTLDGQIRPGDVDRFTFRAQAGEQVVIQAQARRLVPFVADAVPGWFQAQLSVYDAQGTPLAFADGYRFDPDPVLCLRIPSSGEYQVEIHDALYRGREDFVYRVQLAVQPFVRSLFPLGGRAGEPTRVHVEGWNLRTHELELDTRPDGDRYRSAVLPSGESCSNAVAYAVGTLPECLEQEPDDRLEVAQRVALPIVVNGRIDKAGDADLFRFEGRAEEVFVAEVQARVLRSPLDSLVQLLDDSGRVILWNDDFEHKQGDLRTDVGVLTHHADSYLRARLPREGSYYLRLSDAQHLGGAGYGYRLRMGAPRPDFALSVTPSTINLRNGIAFPIDVHLQRLDGFEGPVELLLQDAPSGFALQGARVPAGSDHVRMTLTPPASTTASTFPVRVLGRAEIGGESVTRTAIPCEDSTQAFLWRHLVPSQELLVFAMAGPRRPVPEVAGSLPVELPSGGSVEVLIRLVVGPKPEELGFELDGAPAGITLERGSVRRDGLLLTLAAQAAGSPPHSAGNLIVQVFRDVTTPARAGKPAKTKRVPIGALPAIPYAIVPGPR